ncbi:MAG: Ku protein [Acidobacteriaceae bacterium]
MARPYWSGTIQISLVSFAVKLFVATNPASDIHFHLIDRRTGERVRHQNVKSSAIEQDPEAAADPVEKSDIVKGYEYAHNQYVTIEPEELAHLRVPSKRTMQVTQFVDPSTIDPAFFERPYFIIPENAAQTEAFLTIRQALIDTNKVALSRIAFAGREHVVAIAPTTYSKTKSIPKKSKPSKSKPAAHPGLMAYTLRFAAELRDPAAYFDSIEQLPINADSLSLAKELIHRKSSPFDPALFTDGYETAVKQLVDAKLKHAPIPREAPTPRRRTNVIHLMDALRKSVSDTTNKPTTVTSSAKPTSRKGPSLIKPAASLRPRRDAKPQTKTQTKTQTRTQRTSPRQKTA